MPDPELGPWSVIIGGSEGIGGGFARALADRGINLVLVARRAERLQRMAAELTDSHPAIKVRTPAIDMEQPDAVDQIIAETAALEVGSFIYNAGAETVFRDFVDDGWMRIQGRLQRNFVAQTHLLHHFGRAMCARGRGGIILMGSIAGCLGSPGFSLYGANKAFVHYLSEGLWYELAQRGVHLLCPVIGPTDTPSMRETFGDIENPTDPNYIARGALERIADGPLWIVDDIAEAVANFNAMEPAERARFGARMMENFAITGARVAG
jgi:short-subunit dehydrogenase